MGMMTTILLSAARGATRFMAGAGMTIFLAAAAPTRFSVKRATTTSSGQGNSGNYIEGGTGDNVIIGSDGPDVIYAHRPSAPLLEAGRNQVRGLAGDDIITGGPDNFNEMHGGPGQDQIYAGTFGDWLYGDEDSDNLTGGSGNDIIHGGSGNDTVLAHEGDDLIYTDSGFDVVFGGIGSDTIFGSSGSTTRPANWPAVMPPSFDTVFAGNGNNFLYGEAGIDFIYGGVGTSCIDGGTGNDFIYGGSGTEEIRGGAGDDYLRTGDGQAQLFGGLGDDLVVQIVAANQAITDTPLTGVSVGQACLVASPSSKTALTGRGIHTVNGIERVELVDPSPTGGFTFDVSGWTEAATLVGSPAGNDTVAATVDADMMLADGNLTTSQGGSFLLTNITRASLAGIKLDNTFDVSLWTGTGSLTGGTGLDRLLSVNDANFVLTDASFTRSTGGSLRLERHQAGHAERRPERQYSRCQRLHRRRLAVWRGGERHAHRRQWPRLPRRRTRRRHARWPQWRRCVDCHRRHVRHARRAAMATT